MKKVINLVAVVIIISLVSVTLSLLLMNNDTTFVIPKGTKFIAHRGLSSQYYENSEQAFLGAAKADFFFGIETDIWLTSDNVWVCAHDSDPFIDTTKIISEITYNEAKSLPLDTSEAEYGIPQEDIFVCSFERFLDICVKYKKMPVIELKYIPEVNKLKELLVFIESKISFERVMFISFHTDNINNLHQLNPDLRLMTLTKKSMVANFLSISGANSGIKSTLVTQEMINNVQKNGSFFNVWTINDKQEAKKFMDWKVDFITTDFIFDF